MTHSTPLPTAPYTEQVKRWPATGRHILAQFDEETIVVYQAYCPAIAHFAIEYGYFGGDFSYQRMSWIKPNFLWMMYRSNWAQSTNQEIVLAIRLRRGFFDSLLEQAVVSSLPESGFANPADWQAALQRSEVRLQWDPDHQPDGQPCARRALQLGLRGQTLHAYGSKEIVEIIDMSELIAEQRRYLGKPLLDGFVTPLERVYTPSSLAAVQARLDWMQPGDVAPELGRNADRRTG